MAEYDVIVIGGGTAGLVAAVGSAGIGARVALVERARLGGECLWNGCVPSKALIAAGRAARATGDAARFGVFADGPRVDFGRSLAWVREAQQRIAPHDSPERLRGLGVDVIEGEARFKGERTLDVGGRALSAPRMVIATGSSPALPPIKGLRDVPFLTNETIFSLQARPSTLLVLGGGPVGLELAQAFARLGTTVHVLEESHRLLAHEDQEMAALVGERLRDEGVHIHLGATVTGVERAGAQLAVHLTSTEAHGNASSSSTLRGDALLIAAGRTVQLDSLALDRGGIEARPEGIVVDRSLHTTASGVWAAGDCVGPLRFTHVADYQARLVVRNAFFPLSGRADYSRIPWVTFTSPELAHVGLTEAEARDRHGDTIRVWRRQFADVDRAIVDGRTHGLVKLITNRRGKILGGHILGHRAGDMIGEITIAMKHGISAQSVASTIHPYPTYAEAIRQGAEGFTKSRFTGALARLVKWYVRR